MENQANFDALARKATQTNALEDLNALFGAAFDLKEWIFIMRGDLTSAYPYIAANAGYADSQPMVRAFTDSERAQRFARENNLAEPDGTCLTLNIPTEKIVEYLEGFMEHGAHGVWFNSDTGSDGFFIPIKQLRPIKEHLAKLKPAAGWQTVEILRVTVQEALVLPTGNTIDTPYKVNFLCRVPPAQIENGQLKTAVWNRISDLIFGESWKAEIFPGAYYTIKSSETRNFGGETVKNQNWLDLGKTGDDLYYFFIVSENGEVRKVEASEFQQNVDADFQNEGVSAAPSSTAAPPPKPRKNTLLLVIQDGLGFPSGFVSEASFKLNIFCRVPPEWTDGEQLKADSREKIFEFLYGVNWRMGNDDGSRYVVIDSFSKVFDEETVKNTRWEGTENTADNHYKFYLVGDDGAIRSVKEEEFQADIDAELKSDATDEARAHQDQMAGLGMSQTADGGFDINLSIDQHGSVNFETNLAPFYRAIMPLLTDFQGTGDFVALLAFEPGAMSEFGEFVLNNPQGPYFRSRGFIYVNPKNGVRIGVTSFHSNHLRHIRSNAELIVSIELCKNLDNQTAALYYVFRGPRADVLNLAAAIQPLLEANNYQAAQ
ncbi:MAG TPA: hypothetical protein VNB22_00750 [Pyrinomonadaceae bacterium]|nr:hypothetical protein [Pyrinomonadaceae bacterium]